LISLKNRGIKDVFVACVDGLTGFPDAIGAVFPKMQLQLCIVHRVRNSSRFVAWKDRQLIATDLKKIYPSITVSEAEKELEAFAEAWDSNYPAISQSWRNHWPNLIVLMKSGRLFIPLMPLNP
jgi:transposase-like protein